MSADGFALSHINHCWRPDGSWLLEEHPETEAPWFPSTEDMANRLLDPRLAVAATGTEGVIGFSRRFAPVVGEGLNLPVQIVGLLAHNIPQDAIIVLQLYNSADDQMWTNLITYAWNPPSSDFPLHAFWILPFEVQANRLRVTASAAEYPLISLGAIWAGPLWTTPEGLEQGWSHRVIDPGTVSRSAGQQGYARRRNRYRSFSGRMVDVPLAYAFGDGVQNVVDIQQMCFAVGTTDPVIVLPRTLNADGEYDEHLVHRLGFYGHFTEQGAIKQQAANLYSWESFKIDELL